LPDGRLSCAFMSDPDLLGRGASASWNDLLEAAPHTLARVHAGGYRPAVRPRLQASGSALLDRLTGHGWLAVGDAAASYDPLSSHGIATALATGCDAADALLAAWRGDREAITEYEDRVRSSYEHYLLL